MGLRRFSAGGNGGKRVRAIAEGGPSAEVLVGLKDHWPMGVAHVVLPAGGGMPEHDHSSSSTMLIPIEGTVTLIDAEGDGILELEPGSVATIPIGHRVAISNPGGSEAKLMVVFDPPDFTRQLESWPPDVD